MARRRSTRRRRACDAVRRERLAVQLGGAVGTLASLGDDGPAVLRAFAARARARRAGDRRGTPTGRASASWPARSASPRAPSARWRETSCCMAQTEVGEVREGVPGRGGSSTLPHKRNPVAAVAAIACAERAPGARRDAARRDGPGARARGGRVARRVEALRRAPGDRGLGGRVDCATASSTSRSTPSGCGRTST